MGLHTAHLQSATSAPASSEPLVARDLERLPGPVRTRVYGRGPFLLGLALLGGPVVWLADLQLPYPLVYAGCRTGTLLPVYVVAAGVLLLAWRISR